jgi:hypothetical protein
MLSLFSFQGTRLLFSIISTTSRGDKIDNTTLYSFRQHFFIKNFIPPKKEHSNFKRWSASFLSSYFLVNTKINLILLK